MCEVLEPLVVFAGLALLLKILTDAILRNKLVNQGKVDENVKYLFAQYGLRKKSDIKWGLVLIGIGLAIMVYQFTEITSEAVLGLMFLFAGIAFLLSYFLNQNGPNNPNDPK